VIWSGDRKPFPLLRLMFWNGGQNTIADEDRSHITVTVDLGANLPSYLMQTPPPALLAAPNGGETERTHFWQQRLQAEERLRHGGRSSRSSSTRHTRCARGFPHAGNNTSRDVGSALHMGFEGLSRERGATTTGSTMANPYSEPNMGMVFEEVAERPQHDLIRPNFGPAGEMRHVPRVRRTREVPWGPPTAPKASYALHAGDPPYMADLQSGSALGWGSPPSLGGDSCNAIQRRNEFSDLNSCGQSSAGLTAGSASTVSEMLAAMLPKGSRAISAVAAMGHKGSSSSQGSYSARDRRWSRSSTTSGSTTGSRSARSRGRYSVPGAAAFMSPAAFHAAPDSPLPLGGVSPPSSAAPSVARFLGTGSGPGAVAFLDRPASSGTSGGFPSGGHAERNLFPTSERAASRLKR